jgi:uncharacterized protein
MKIDNEFTVGVPIERAWAVLTDLEGIAPCLPGARLTGVDDGVYTGKVKIKVGPVVSEYAGTAQFAAKDDAAYTAVIDAKGKDSRGAGNASAAIHAALRADGDRTVVSVSTDLNVTGKIAQFGSGMIKEVSAKLLGQFAANLEEKLLAPAGETPAGETPAPASGSASTPESGTTPAAPVAPSASPNGTTTVVAEPRAYRVGTDDDPEPLDLMAVAGGSVYKRLIPVGVAALAVIGVLVLRARRRR